MKLKRTIMLQLFELKMRMMAVMHRRQVMVLMMSLLVTREFQKNFVYSISLAIF